MHNFNAKLDGSMVTITWEKNKAMFDFITREYAELLFETIQNNWDMEYHEAFNMLCSECISLTLYCNECGSNSAHFVDGTDCDGICLACEKKGVCV